MQNVHLIDLGDERYAIVDRADAVLVAGFNWRLRGNGYVYADRSKMRIALHRLIAGAGDHERVDHANMDPLDNRTANLRIATASQNGANRTGPAKIGRTSRYKGVSWNKSRQCWVVYVHVDGKTHWVGRFPTEEDGARAYNRAALAAWGEFARLNDLPG